MAVNLDKPTKEQQELKTAYAELIKVQKKNRESIKEGEKTNEDIGGL